MSDFTGYESVSQVPLVRSNRNVFDRSFSRYITFNHGKLIPIFCEYSEPGDTLSISVDHVLRMTTPQFATMQNSYYDYHFFAVPFRLLWDHWEEFFGENKTGHWVQQPVYTIPKISVPFKGFPNQSFGDYIDIPPNVPFSMGLNHLPFRANGKIWNDWFRDQNYQNPQYVYTGDALTVAPDPASVYDEVNTAHYGYAPLPINRYHDYFSSSLPAPQKGPTVGVEVDLPLLPVVPLPNRNVYGGELGASALTFTRTDGAPSFGTTVAGFTQLATPDGNRGALGQWATPSVSGPGSLVYPDNLYAVQRDPQYGTPTGEGSAQILINNLRTATQIQLFYELQSRMGSRYVESILGFFGVRTSDARLQRAEFLGGKRGTFNVFQVEQTAPAQSASPSENLGSVGAFIHSAESGQHFFTHSFEEHCIVLGYISTRVSHVYSQGIPRWLTHTELFDFYFPQFAHVGEQPVYSFEIYWNGTHQTKPPSDPSQPPVYTWGYQPNYEYMRINLNRANGYMRPGISGSLDVWHYADYYPSAPQNNSAWHYEPTANIDRTLTVPSSEAPNVFGHIKLNVRHVRVLPVFGDPGYLDHNYVPGK